MEAIAIAVISVLGGSSGIFVGYKAYLDHKANRAAREDDLGERFSARLETRLDRAEDRIQHLEVMLDQEQAYNTLLSLEIVRLGGTIPERKTRADHRTTP